MSNWSLVGVLMMCIESKGSLDWRLAGLKAGGSASQISISCAAWSRNQSDVAKPVLKVKLLQSLSQRIVHIDSQDIVQKISYSDKTSSWMSIMSPINPEQSPICLWQKTTALSPVSISYLRILTVKLARLTENQIILNMYKIYIFLAPLSCCRNSLNGIQFTPLTQYRVGPDFFLITSLLDWGMPFYKGDSYFNFFQKSLFCMLPSFATCLKVFKTVFVFALRPFLPM